MWFKEGAVVNYRVFLGIKKKCKILRAISFLAVEWTQDGIRRHTLYKYKVEFKNGKQKIVSENKLSY